MKPRSIYLVAKREIVETLSRKSFFLSILIPLAILTLTLGIGPAAEKVTRYVETNVVKTANIGVIAADPSLVQSWQEKLLETKLQNGMPQFTLHPILLAGLPPEAAEAGAQAKVRSREWEAYATIDGDLTGSGSINLNVHREIPFNYSDKLYQSLTDVVRQARLKAEGLDPDRIRHLNRGLTWNSYVVADAAPPAGQAETKQRQSFDQKFMSALACVLLMFFLVYGTGEALLKGVILEKFSRMVEILLSSLSPTEILAGKILGFYVVGLVQFVLWIVLGSVIASYRGMSLSDTIDPAYFLRFLIFLTTGYLFYSTLFASIGVTQNQDGEAHIYLVSISMLMVMPLFFSFVIVTQPNWWPVRVASFVPLLSPLMMAMRMAVTDVPLWEILLVTLNLLFFSLLGILAAAKLFRVALLMTGKSLSPFEMWRWLRHREASGLLES